MNEIIKNTCKVIVLLGHYRPNLPTDFSNVLACHISSQSGVNLKNSNVCCTWRSSKKHSDCG